jgi:ubiquinone/menaquinone biosynthesis C-methylase UbiE
MAETTEYFLATGEQDRERLEIINRLYNPRALEFMIKAGLSNNLTVLEIGCGTGHMAVEIAKIVGKDGKVIATDVSETQLDIAKVVAKEAGCLNIEFLQLDINSSLQIYYNQFDFIYGRWVIEFSKDTKFTFKELYSCLKKNGVFAYEGVDISDKEYFSYPRDRVVDEWFQLIYKNWKSNKMDIHFVKWLYHAFRKVNALDLQIESNQAILKTPEEKSILRYGLTSVKETYYKKNFLNTEEYKLMVEKLINLEKSEKIVGYVRNILVSAKKY